MKDFIETITGERILKDLNINSHELFQLVDKGIIKAYEFYLDPYFELDGQSKDFAQAMQKLEIQLGEIPEEADFVNSEGRAFKEPYIVDPNNVENLIFEMSTYEDLKKDYGLRNAKDKSKETEPGNIIPCDPGTQWKEIKITLTSHETVTIKTPKGTKSFHFSELNFKDGRRSADQFTKLWLYLIYFCKVSGRITSETLNSNIPIGGHISVRHISKSISDLNKKLQKVFGIDDKFCHGYDPENGWLAKCVFNDKTEF